MSSVQAGLALLCRYGQTESVHKAHSYFTDGKLEYNTGQLVDTTVMMTPPRLLTALWRLHVEDRTPATTPMGIKKQFSIRANPI